MTKLTLQEVQRRFEAIGCVLLTREYVNTTTKMPYRCSCGNDTCVLSVASITAGTKGCKNCTQKRREQTCMARYGENNPAKVQVFKIKIAETNMATYGVPCVLQANEVKEKIRQTNLANLGVEYPTQSAAVAEKVMATVQLRFGVNNISQSQEIKDKKAATCMERYNVICSLRAEFVLAKTQKTLLELFGVTNVSQSEEIKERKRLTTLENYNVDNPFQSEEVKEKIKETLLRRYDVSHPMHDPDIFHRVMSSAFGTKPYTFPNGAIVQVQGYEPFCLDHLIQTECVSEDDLLDGYATMPEIWYESESRKHRYYPDIHIPSQHKLIEIKSEYTVGLNPDLIRAKLLACVTAGYSTELRVYDRKGTLLRTENM